MNPDQSQISAPPAGNKLRLHSVDILRGIAALAVAFYHIWGHDGSYAWQSAGIVTQTPNPSLFVYLISPFRWGYLGVSLFLVLSGFCIHLPYARKKYSKGSYEFKGSEFFTRRIWRLYPAYIVALLGTAFVLIAASYIPSLHIGDHFAIPTTWDIVSHLTMLHGFLENQFYSVASVFWSLSLEFQLYLAYPLFLLAFRKFGIGRSVLFFAIVSLIWRYIAIYYLGNGLISIASVGPFVAMGTLPARMLEWLLGAFVAEYFAKHHANRGKGLRFSGMRMPLLIGSIVTFAIAIETTIAKAAWVFTDGLFGLAFALLLAVVTLSKVGDSNEKDPSEFTSLFIKLGIMSYSFYLIHSQFGWLVSIFVPSESHDVSAFLIRVICLVISLIPIYFFFRWFEKPFLSVPKQESKLYPIYKKIGSLLGVS